MKTSKEKYADYLPTDFLPPCPICSNLLVRERPFWRVARNTTKLRGKPCYILQGCQHAVAGKEGAIIRDDPEELKLVEEIWQAESEKLFELRTARWTDVERERFKRALNDKHTLPGVSDPLPMEQLDQQKSDAQTKPMAAVIEGSPFGENL